MAEHQDFKLEDDPASPLRVFRPSDETEDRETAAPNLAVSPTSEVSLPTSAGETDVARLRLGVRSSLALLAIFLIQIFPFTSGSKLLNDLTSFSTMLWLASVWSGWSISIWLLIRQPISIVRVGLICCSYSWHCILMMLGRDHPIERYMILLGYFGFLQAIACIVVNCPTFRLPGEPQNIVAGKRQFSILTIALITTGLAVVMFSAREYQPQLIDKNDFFSSTLLTMPALLLTFVVASLAGSSKLSFILGVFLVAGAATLSASLMVAVEGAHQNPATASTWDEMGFVYTVVDSIIGLVVFCFGRLALDDAKIGPA